MNLLYVEDNIDLAMSLKDHLGAWFNVDVARTCEQGLIKAYEVDYDIILLDYYLPDGTGAEICEEIRETNKDSLIVFLSQNAQKNDIVHILTIGADDYLTKPFNIGELTARIQALIRRKFADSHAHALQIDQLVLDQRTMRVYFAGKRIPLKRKEFLLLEYLMLHQGQVVTRSRLYEHVWNQSYYSSNTVDVHIKRLRNKIEKKFKVRFIKTVYGIGYQADTCLRTDDESQELFASL